MNSEVVKWSFSRLYIFCAHFDALIYCHSMQIHNLDCFNAFCMQQTKATNYRLKIVQIFQKAKQMNLFLCDKKRLCVLNDSYLHSYDMMWYAIFLLFNSISLKRYFTKRFRRFFGALVFVVQRSETK